MEPSLSVVIFGTSLFSHAIEATLAAMPGVQVCRCDPEQGIDTELIAASALIVIEAGSLLAYQLALLPRNTVPILIVDARNGQITVIQRQLHDFHQMTDLENLITNHLHLDQYPNDYFSPRCVSKPKEVFK